MPAAWKRFVVITALVALAARSNAADPPPVVLPLTQFEVLGLVQQGIGDEAVVAKLRETRSTFRLSANEVQMLKALGVSDRVLTAMAGDAPAQPGAKAAAGRPVGKWVRESGPVRVALHFAEDRLTVTATVPNPDEEAATPTLTVTADADYSVSRDGLLYGVITGFDCDHPEAAVYQCLAGHTFSARCRVDGSVLAVRDVKFLGSGVLFEGKDGGAVSMIVLGVAGRYERDDGSKPAAPKKPAKPRPNSAGAQRIVPPAPVAVRQIVGVTPDGQPIERVGIDFNTPPPAPLPPQSHTGGITLPSPQYLAHPPQYIPPQPWQQMPPPPLPTGGPVMPTNYSDGPPPVSIAPQPVPSLPPPQTPPPPTLPPSPAGSKLAGIWVREFDGMQVVLKLTDKRLFATLNVAYVEDGKPGEVRMTFRADADYAVGPDGTLFGVVTGTDFTPPKGDDADRVGALKMMAELNGMPFCFRYRIDEGVLNVRDLRCGISGEDATSAAVLGRYVRAEKEPAPPKPGRKPFVNYSTDPVIRMDQLINQSEDIRSVGETAPAPRPVTPESLHGGIIR
jgi:hypothetical protein